MTLNLRSAESDDSIADCVARATALCDDSIPPTAMTGMSSCAAPANVNKTDATSPVRAAAMRPCREVHAWVNSPPRSPVTFEITQSRTARPGAASTIVNGDGVNKSAETNLLHMRRVSLLNAPKRTEFHVDLHDERRMAVSV